MERDKIIIIGSGLSISEQLAFSKVMENSKKDTPIIIYDEEIIKNHPELKKVTLADDLDEKVFISKERKKAIVDSFYEKPINKIAEEVTRFPKLVTLPDTRRERRKKKRKKNKKR